jgi:hypothetical protein
MNEIAPFQPLRQGCSPAPSHRACEEAVTLNRGVAEGGRVGDDQHQLPPPPLPAGRHPARRLAVFRFPLSYRNVEDLLAERGIDVSYETVRRWALKFGTLYARYLRRLRPRPSSRWQLDEVFVAMRFQPLPGTLHERHTGRAGPGENPNSQDHHLPVWPLVGEAIRPITV